MTPEQEEQDLYAALGEAIERWSNVEMELWWLFHYAIGAKDADVSAASFYAIENFRSKLRMIDATLRVRLHDAGLLEQWETLRKRIDRQSSLRNQLAHHQLAFTDDNRPGHRVELRPPLRNPHSPGPEQRGLRVADLRERKRTFDALEPDIRAFIKAADLRPPLPIEFPPFS